MIGSQSRNGWPEDACTSCQEPEAPQSLFLDSRMLQRPVLTRTSCCSGRFSGRGGTLQVLLLLLTESRVLSVGLVRAGLTTANTINTTQYSCLHHQRRLEPPKFLISYLLAPLSNASVHSVTAASSSFLDPLTFSAR